MKPHACPNCQSSMEKVIYMGLPGELCIDSCCSTLIGLASYLPIIASTPDGYAAFYVYEGAYLPALFHWILGDEND